MRVWTPGRGRRRCCKRCSRHRQESCRMDLSRRDCVVSGAAHAQSTLQVAQATGAPAPRGFDPADPSLKYELVVANGDVLDPSQNLRGKRDIGIKNGQIAAIAPSIAADRTVQRIDA